MGGEQRARFAPCRRLREQAQDRWARPAKTRGKPGEAGARWRRPRIGRAANLGQGGQGDGPPKPGQGEGNNKTSGGNIGGPGGKLDLRSFDSEIAEHSGKSWGELPGEIKTKIIQQMKARYGEDYARNIRLYFEQLAERK